MAKAAAGNGSVSLLLLAIGLFLFLSPFTDWWTNQNLPWYTAFLIWLGYIGLIAVVVGRRGRHDV